MAPRCHSGAFQALPDSALGHLSSLCASRPRRSPQTTSISQDFQGGQRAGLRLPLLPELPCLSLPQFRRQRGLLQEAIPHSHPGPSPPPPGRPSSQGQRFCVYRHLPTGSRAPRGQGRPTRTSARPAQGGLGPRLAPPLPPLSPSLIPSDSASLSPAFLSTALSVSSSPSPSFPDS